MKEVLCVLESPHLGLARREVGLGGNPNARANMYGIRVLGPVTVLATWPFDKMDLMNKRHRKDRSDNLHFTVRHRLMLQCPRQGSSERCGCLQFIQTRQAGGVLTSALYPAIPGHPTYRFIYKAAAIHPWSHSHRREGVPSIPNPGALHAAN